MFWCSVNLFLGLHFPLLLSNPLALICGVSFSLYFNTATVSDRKRGRTRAFHQQLWGNGRLETCLFKLCTTRPLPLHQSTPQISVKMILLILAQRSSAILLLCTNRHTGNKKIKKIKNIKKNLFLPSVSFLLRQCLAAGRTLWTTGLECRDRFLSLMPR